MPHLSAASSLPTVPLRARPFRDERDRERMRELLATGARARIPASYMHPGCLDWDTHCPPDAREDRRNFRLWERPGNGDTPPTLEAFGMFWRHEGMFDLFTSPALYGTRTHAAVMEEYLAWAETRAREAGVKQIAPFWALETDTVLIRLMRERGFDALPAEPPPPLFERSLDELPVVSLLEGYRVRGVATPDEGTLRAEVTYAAFRCTEPWEEYRDNYAKFRASTVYDGERDLLVRSPEGRGASACTLWFDPVNGVGLFEPVATHPDFQGRGLGKAVMAEGLRRMKAAGMRRAILGFDPNNTAARNLYTSLGFRAAAYFATYRKGL